MAWIVPAKTGVDACGRRPWDCSRACLSFCCSPGGLFSVTVFVFATMAGSGFFKGMYDANIWASTCTMWCRRNDEAILAVGVMNSVGWLGGVRPR